MSQAAKREDLDRTGNRGLTSQQQTEIRANIDEAGTKQGILHANRKEE